MEQFFPPCQVGLVFKGAARTGWSRGTSGSGMSIGGGGVGNESFGQKKGVWERGG